jgi:hypothetical protein
MQYYTQRRPNKTIESNRILKIRLLEEESIQILFGNRLTKSSKMWRHDVEEKLVERKTSNILRYKLIKKKT